MIMAKTKAVARLKGNYKGGKALYGQIEYYMFFTTNILYTIWLILYIGKKQFN